MSEYTKGPWEVGIGIRCVHVAVGGNKFKIVTGDDAEACANANLIAAAPDMYEALKAFKDAWEGDPCGMDDFKDAFFTAVDALAKAEGK